MQVDGGPWVDAAVHASSGSVRFDGVAEAWREDRIDFGADLAGREVRFRLRAVADGSFAPRPIHWSVSRIEVQGAQAPMFARVDAPQITVSAAHSGAWFPPHRSGEGWVIEVLGEDLVAMTWFTYPSNEPGAEQRWLQGVGRIEGNRVVLDDVLTTRDGRFGDDFDPDAVERLPWGRVELEFNGCDALVVHWQGPPGYESGTLEATRLTALHGIDCNGASTGNAAPGHSGAWVDPQRSGEGWFLQEIDPQTVVVFWFTYTPDGEQAWLSGLGSYDGNTLVVPDLQITQGTRFGGDFDAADIERTHWGTLEFEFDGCDAATVHYSAVDPAYGSGTQAARRCCAEPWRSLCSLVLQAAIRTDAALRTRHVLPR
jgi:hypothetical protein